MAEFSKAEELSPISQLVIPEGKPIGEVVGSFQIESAKDYEIIYPAGGVTWSEAKAHADSLNAADPDRWIYLATITSQAEQDEIYKRVGSYKQKLWLGGSDSALEGAWRWTEGPEGQINAGIGIQFWSGLGKELGGVPISGAYSNWHSFPPAIEPNNDNDEDFLTYYPQINGSWNDNNHTVKQAFLLEKERLAPYMFSLVNGKEIPIIHYLSWMETVH